MSTSPVVIPYEKQTDPQTHRGCGAACLSMIYKSFGKDVPQDSIWPLIAKQNRFGSVASTTYLMAQHALSQGLQAVVIQARHPMQVLRQCKEQGIRAILNLRLQSDSAAGHFAVLVDVDDKNNVILHDPLLGPSRRLTHAELLQLWHPQSANSEISGNVIIGIQADSAPLAPCEFCRTPYPPRVDCPRCAKSVPLLPGALLGCIRDGCIARLWNYVCCPSCDFVWSFNEAGKTTPQSGVPKVEIPFPEPPSIDKAFAELEKFCARLMAIPAVADHPDIKLQMNVIQGSKEKLKLAQAEEAMQMKAQMDRVNALKQTSTEKAEAHNKKVADMKAPLPPLDGNALGHALLKNLGFK